jgi:ABC-type sugar transport system ATPase subunit
MADLLLRAENIRKSFHGVPALLSGALALRPGTVHALCGGNGAGKSTFLNIIMGLLEPDGGEIEIDGKPIRFSSPGDALASGVAMITQELSLIEDMSVAENVVLGREPLSMGLVDYRATQRYAEALFSRLGFDLPTRARLGDLSMARRQMVEIARAIGYDSHILIMDEPTSALGETETRVLFAAIEKLKRLNVGIIYVSHRLNELAQIADDYTIFRDGRFIQTGAMAELTRDGLVRLIVGRELHRHQPSARARAKPIVEVSGLSRAGEFEDVSLEVGAGEVLGIYGLIGAGRSEFLNCLFGLNRPDRGEVRLAGAPVVVASPRDAFRLGMSLVPEDRKDWGVIACLSVRENVVLSFLKRLSVLTLVRRQLERKEVARMIDLLRIRTASSNLPVENLSGGNQQKVVFARCLLTDPRLLLCDEPTRGVDEGAKQQIFQIIDQFVSSGRAAIVVSSELEEILQISDRIIVFRSGKMAGEVSRAEASQEVLTGMAA